MCTKGFAMATVTVATFTNNTFGHIEKSGISFEFFVNATFENNTLSKLAANAIEVKRYSSTDSPDTQHLVFAGNIFQQIENSSLHLSLVSDTQVPGNIFMLPCDCNLLPTFHQYIESDPLLIEQVYNDSYCRIAKPLWGCFSHSDGFVMASSYEELVCDSPVLNCSSTPEVTQPNPNIQKANDILNEQRLLREDQLIQLVVAVAIAGVVAVLLLTACLWLGGRKVRSRECHLRLSTYLSRLVLSLIHI